MFNDITIKRSLWGKVIIDTIKVIVVSNISNKALDEIETVVTNNLLGNRGLRKKWGRGFLIRSPFVLGGNYGCK